MMWRWRVGHAIESTPGRLILTVAIIVNAVTIGVQADYDSDSDIWIWIELGFTIIYSVELAANLFAFQWIYLRDIWNWLDIIIVMSSIIDLIMNAVQDNATSGITILRLLRVVRVLLRMSRIVKVAGFTQALFIILQGYIAGMRNALWVFGLLTLVLYIFAVLAKAIFGPDSGLANDLKEGGYTNIDTELLFGTIPRCFVTLWQFITWDNSIELQRPIGEVMPAAWIFFVMLAAFVGVGLLELLFAIFVQFLLEEKAAIEKQRVRQKERLKGDLADKIESFYNTLDKDGDGMLSVEEITEAMGLIASEEFIDTMRSLEIDDKLFGKAMRIADINNSGEVSKTDFYEAIVSLTEEPRSSQLREFQQQGNSIRRAILHKLEVNQHLLATADLELSATVEKRGILLDNLERLMEKYNLSTCLSVCLPLGLLTARTKDSPDIVELHACEEAMFATLDLFKEIKYESTLPLDEKEKEELNKNKLLRSGASC